MAMVGNFVPCAENDLFICCCPVCLAIIGELDTIRNKLSAGILISKNAMYASIAQNSEILAVFVGKVKRLAHFIGGGSLLGREGRSEHLLPSLRKTV